MLEKNYTLRKTNEMSVKDFIDNNLKLYSAHSNIRAIPFLGDGMKISHRKALYGMLSRGENADKDTVERLAAYCASETDYHHGTFSMENTIVGLAQNFAGANNIPLIQGIGQFGTRIDKNPASSRYIKAKLSENFRKLFKKEDDIILEYHYSNNIKIEPKYFIPILPVCLINGTEGMGTGHSTFIMGYNPDDIKKSILALLKNKDIIDGNLKPYYTDYKGIIEKNVETGQLTFYGKYEIISSSIIKITELPLGVQDDKYEKHLFKLEESGLIKSFKNQSDKFGFDFEISVPKTTTQLTHELILKHFKLVSKETENLTLWDTKGVITKYNSIEAIIREFLEWRLIKYEERRQALIKQVTEEISDINEKIRFINFYLDNTNLFRNTPKKELLELLLKNNFTLPDKMLLLAIYNLTKDKIDELLKTLEDKKIYLDTLNKTNAKEMYLKELTELKF